MSSQFDDVAAAAAALAAAWEAAETRFFAVTGEEFVNVEALTLGAARKARSIRAENDYRYAVIARRHGRGWKVYPKLQCFGLETVSGERIVRF